MWDSCARRPSVALPITTRSSIAKPGALTTALSPPLGLRLGLLPGLEEPNSAGDGIFGEGM